MASSSARVPSLSFDLLDPLANASQTPSPVRRDSTAAVSYVSMNKLASVSPQAILSSNGAGTAMIGVQPPLLAASGARDVFGRMGLGASGGNGASGVGGRGDQWQANGEVEFENNPFDGL